MRRHVSQEERHHFPNPESVPSNIEVLYMLYHVEEFPIPRSGARMDDIRIKKREKFLNESNGINEKKK